MNIVRSNLNLLLEFTVQYLLPLMHADVVVEIRHDQVHTAAIHIAATHFPAAKLTLLTATI